MMSNTFWQEIQVKAKKIRRDITVLQMAFRHPDTPWHARLFVAIIVGYALSPIDLIPDFIPVLGYLDDLILLPAGIILALKLIPREVIESCRAELLAGTSVPRRKSWLAGTLIILLWLAIIFTIARNFWPQFMH